MQKGGPSLLIDIGSESVGVCIVELLEGANPILSHVERIPIANASGVSTEALSDLAIAALRGALRNIQNVAVRPHEAHIVLAAPWYSAHMRSLNFHSEKPTRISLKTVMRSIENYHTQRVGKRIHARSMVESLISQMSVNGYPSAIKEPVFGTILKIRLYESESDRIFLSHIGETVHSFYGGISLHFHTFPFTACTVLRALRDEENFVFIDVGGEITDIAIVSRDGMNFIGSFPRGSLTLLRALSGSGSMADTASRLSLFAKGEFSAEEQNAFSEKFKTGAALWNREYQNLLDTAVVEVPIPHITFLAAGKEELLWFEKALTFSESMFPTHPILITPDFFQTALTTGENSFYDSFLSIAALSTGMPLEEIH